MLRICFVSLFIIMTSCNNGSKQIEDTNSEILKIFASELKLNNLVNNDTVYILKNDFIKSNSDSLFRYNKTFKITNYNSILDEEIEEFIAIHKFDLQEKEAFILATQGIGTSIGVKYLRVNDEWRIDSTEIQKMARLKKSQGVKLSFEIIRKKLLENDSNIKKVNIGMTKSSVEKVMNNNQFIIKDSLDFQILNYSSYKGDLIIHRIFIIKDTVYRKDMSHTISLENI